MEQAVASLGRSRKASTSLTSPALVAKVFGRSRRSDGSSSNG